MASHKNLSRFEGSVHILIVPNEKFVQVGNSFWFKVENTYENGTCRFSVFCIVFYFKKNGQTNWQKNNYFSLIQAQYVVFYNNY